MTLLGTVEMGGTKTDVSVGTSPDDLTQPHRIATTAPDSTLPAIVEFLAEYHVSAVGVACFGPLDLNPRSGNFGALLATPKPDWSGVPVYARLVADLGIPVAIDTDVNGAALGEGRWGAAQGMSNYVYVTVGTGVGGGVVIDGRTVSGERHPEVGHIPVRRMEGDGYEGRCPYHGDCLEGMAAGPSLEARFGNPSTWAGNDLVVDLAAFYLAQLMQTLFYSVAPERIIVGGGVSGLPSFHERLKSRLGTMIAGYPSDPDLDLLISEPGLGDLSGLAGGLVLAEGIA